MALTTKRIIALPSQNDPQEGDYLAIDNMQSGTHKIPVGRIGVEVDDTLTEAGKAADAKAVGDALGEIRSQVEATEDAIDEIRSQTEVTGTASGAIATFTDGADAPMKSCIVSIEPQQSGTGTPSPDNVRPISGWESVSVMVSPTEDEADATTTTVNLGRTVYGGEAEIVGGSLTDKLNLINLDNTTRCGISSQTSDVVVFDAPFNNNEWATHSSTPNAISNRFSTSTPNGQAGRMVVIDQHLYFVIAKSELSSLDESGARAWLNDHPTQFIYELATPQTYQLTPTQIKTLLGENNVWADSGDIEVVYVRDLNLAINNLLNNNGTRSLGMMAMSAPTDEQTEEPTDEQSGEDMR